MRVSKESLSHWVFVRRVRSGSVPFRWEVHREGCAEPIFVSEERFSSMEAAHRAGQIRLPEFIHTVLPVPPVSEPLRPSLSVGDRAWQVKRFHATPIHGASAASQDTHA
jgi:hypothetical protein